MCWFGVVSWEVMGGDRPFRKPIRSSQIKSIPNATEAHGMSGHHVSSGVLFTESHPRESPRPARGPAVVQTPAI